MENIDVKYDGKCAFAVSTGKTDVESGNHSLTLDGSEYRFSNPVAKFLFRILPNRSRKADDVWMKMN